MFMLAYKFRLYPTKKQETTLVSWLEECRMLYNHFISERKQGWAKNKKSFTLYTQLNGLVKIKKTYPKLRTVYSQVLQNVGMRVDRAYQGFFRRLKRHEKPGYPRFKSYGRYDSFCYPTAANIKMDEDKIRLPMLGEVAWVKHREIEGKPKTLTVKRQHGKWFAYLVTDTERKIECPKSNENVGVDVGILTFAALSDGNNVENPRFFETKQKELAKKNRAFQKARDAKKGVVRAKKALIRVHEKIGNNRHNFVHQVTNSLVQKYNVICVEDINANEMLKKRWCNKQILDAAWGNFLDTLTFKAECAGRKLVRVNPAYTSQTCSKCGTRVLHELKDRVFNCGCGHSENRDLNAAKNILRLGLQSLAQA